MASNQKGLGAIIIFLIVFVILGVITILYLINFNSQFSNQITTLVNPSASPKQTTKNTDTTDLSKSNISCNFPDEIDDCDDNAEFSSWVDDGLP